MISKQEQELYKRLGHLGIVFDVGCKKDNPFDADQIHQFDPVDYSEYAKGIFNCVAVSDYIGKGKYRPEYESMIKRKDLKKLKWSWITHKYRTVPVITIDYYCEQKGIDHIDFLKIDTEGSDLNVIKGSLGMLNKIKYIQFEDWPTIPLSEFKKILKGWNIEKIESSPVNYLATR